jgi:hypothetical protein
LIRAEGRSLGYSSATAIEFGVVSGKGLLALEEYAVQVTKESGIKVNRVGFDTGHGFPASADYGDLTSQWAEGDFDMHVEERHGRKIRHPYMLRANVPFQPIWAEQMFQTHFFDHHRYTQLLAHQDDRVLPIPPDK